MPDPIRIYVPAVPVAQPRPRATIRGFHAAVYTPSKHPVEAFKATVRMAAADVMRGRAPLQGPLRVDAEFVFPRPRNRVWKTKPMPRERHTKKPDRDNLDKAALDALT
ncbi:MAG: RusA family crossover junction endodeoxyribonuclease, partial [Planctomycetota bacterium]